MNEKVYTTIGASNHANSERAENDYYATDPKAVRKLLEVETFKRCIWECACGGGHISQVLKEYGHEVISTDIVYRGYIGTRIVDFFEASVMLEACDIITNPPYKYAREFVERAIELSRDGTKIAMLLKLTFLEGKSRRELFAKHPPETVYVFSERIQCAKNGNFEGIDSPSAIAYAWFVWSKGYSGDTKIKWI